jgi:hypothetical protein
MQSVAEHAAQNGQPEGTEVPAGSIGTAQDVNELIENLEREAPQLRPQAMNANQIVPPELLTFLLSERGREFGESLRFETLERLRQASERAQTLGEELREAECRVQSLGRVFAFVVSTTQR